MIESKQGNNFIKEDEEFFIRCKKLEKDAILKNHNYEPYICMEDFFKEKNSGVIKKACGTGKSYLLIQYAKDYPNQKILILEKTDSIIYQIKNELKELESKNPELVFNNIFFMTYTAFSRMTKEELRNLEFHLLVADEYQHLTGPEWGARFLYAKYNIEGIKTLGLSATGETLESFVKGRSLEEEFFDGNVIYDQSVADAIDNHILPTFDYYAVLSKKMIDKKIKPIENALMTGSFSDEFKKTTMSELKNVRKTTEVNEQIRMFVEQILPKNSKGMVFTSKGELDKTIEESKHWFSSMYKKEEVNIYYAHSKYKKQSIKNLDEFFNDNDESKLRVMFSIDMLLEGVHVPKVDWILILRNTNSINIIIQAICRALDSNDISSVPIVIDVGANLYAVEKFREKIELGRYLKRKKDKDISKNDLAPSKYELYYVASNALVALDKLESRVILSNSQKVGEFIEVMNKGYVPVDFEIGREFSNGERFNFFWRLYQDEICKFLFSDPKFSGDEYAVARSIFLSCSTIRYDIDKVAEYIGFMRYGYVPKINDQKLRFSNGDLVGDFWYKNEHLIISELFSDESDKEAYSIAKSIYSKNWTNKILEYITFLNHGYTPKDLDSRKKFSNGEKVNDYWVKNRVNIVEELYKPKYDKKFRKARKKVLNEVQNDESILYEIFKRYALFDSFNSTDFESDFLDNENLAISFYEAAKIYRETPEDVNIYEQDENDDDELTGASFTKKD